tara:strand:+ start:186 stop:377 length:192 start_codon:yes stop_codon:yes gene_type:complete
LVDADHLECVLAGARNGLTFLFDELKLYSSDSSEDRDERTHIYALISRLNFAIEEAEKKIIFS